MIPDSSRNQLTRLPGGFAQWVFGFFGIVGTLFGLYSYFDTRPTRSLAYDGEHIDVRKFQEFLENVGFDHVAVGEQRLSSSFRYISSIRIINNSNNEIDKEHLVGEIKIRIPSKSQLISANNPSLYNKFDFLYDTEAKLLKININQKWYPGEYFSFILSNNEILDIGSAISGFVRGTRGIEEIRPTYIYFIKEFCYRYRSIILSWLLVLGLSYYFIVIKFRLIKLKIHNNNILMNIVFSVIGIFFGVSNWLVQ
jgi:hypothetical protein